MKTGNNYRMIAVTVTPFDKEGRPDLEAIAWQTENLCYSEAEVLLPCASTGEFVKLDTNAREEILRTVAQQNRWRKNMMAGTCDTSVQRVSHSIQVAKQYGYDSCIVCPPYYYGLDQASVLKFYREVCAAAEGMPVYAYHVPFFTTGIEIPTYKKLLEIPNLVGLKDSSANMKRIAHLCDIAKRERPEFTVYTGTDDCLLPALCAGCHGSMTALAASTPSVIAAIYRAFDRKDLDTAMQLQRSILPIIRQADSLAFPVGYKLLAKACGMQMEEGPSTQEEIQVWNTMLGMLEELRDESRRLERY